MLQIVELRPAYTWTCDDCGRDNFGSAICIEDTDITDKLSAAHNPEGAEGHFINLPRFVKCQFCKNQYETELR